MSQTTIIRVKIETYEKLKKIKVHPRESFDEVIQRLLNLKESVVNE